MLIHNRSCTDDAHFTDYLSFPSILSSVSVSLDCGYRLLSLHVALSPQKSYGLLGTWGQGVGGDGGGEGGL